MPKHGRFDKRVSINLTQRDYVALSQRAEERGFLLAPFIREAALAESRGTVVIPPELPNLLERLRTDVNRVGTNVNQIALHANIWKRVSLRHIIKTRKFVEELDEATQILRTVIFNLSD